MTDQDVHKFEIAVAESLDAMHNIIEIFKKAAADCEGE